MAEFLEIGACRLAYHSDGDGPTLVVVGAGDVPDMHVIADRLAAGIPGARRAVLEDTAHLPSLERPAAFNRLVSPFLREHV